MLLCLLAGSPSWAAGKAGPRNRGGPVPVGYNEGPDRLLAVPKAVKHSNTQLARIPISWPHLEPHDDEFAWTELDRVVALLRQYQIRPLISIYGPPAWAGPYVAGVSCPNDRAADPEWQELWQQVALRYRGALLNIWNEPNHPGFGTVSVERMAELTNEAAAAIWAVDPGRKVLGPAASSGPRGWIAYMRALYRRLRPRIDLSANIYPYGRIYRNFRREANAMRRIAGRRELWITETNVSRAEVGARAQRRFVRTAYRYARRNDIAGLIFHRLWSPFSKADGAGAAWDAGLSALARNGAPRLLYRRIGTLHRGFSPLVFRAGEPGGGIVVTSPPRPLRAARPVSAATCPG
jgi:Glycosyl hydrolases family 39